MALMEELLKLADSNCDQLNQYQIIFKTLLEHIGEVNINEIDLLCQHIQEDLSKGSDELREICLNGLCNFRQTENFKKLISEKSKESILKGIIKVVCESKEVKVLSLCFTFLDANLLSTFQEELVKELLENIADFMSKKPTLINVSLCNFLQSYFKENEKQLSNCIHLLPKLIFLPLVNSSLQVRDVADSTLTAFPKSLLYSENEHLCNMLLKLVKEQYCKDLLELFKEKQELYVLKIWKHIVCSLGKTLHANLSAMTPFFQIIERGFKSTSDDVCKMSFIVWKSLISNFALEDSVLNDSKKLRFILKPFKNISRTHESISLAVCDTWWHLAWSLSQHLSSRFTEVCIPMLEFAVGKPVAGQIEKPTLKTSQNVLIRRSCHLLLRCLEQPDTNSLNRISSPKKLSSNIYPALQVPIDAKVIIRHFKEICSMIKIVLESLGNAKDMANHVECLMKSALFIMSTVIEDLSKETVEAFISLLTLITDVIESHICASLLCLKCIDSLSKLPRTILISHCFNNFNNKGSRKIQDILCTTLLKLLLDPYLLTKDSPKRFLSVFNRLVLAGLSESLNPLLMAEKFTHCLKVAASPAVMDAEVVFEMWSGVASPLLEIIDKTQEVNQGDKREHDFSCLYDVLLSPFECIFPHTMHQFRTKPSMILWSNLYKTFIRCSALVQTTAPNEACEQFCTRLKNAMSQELLLEPHYFETVCYVTQVVLECFDSNSSVSVSSQIMSSPSFMIRRNRPLGNLSSLIDILCIIIKVFYDGYLNAEEEIYQSCTPKAQRKSFICKAAIPVDLVKMLFTTVISGSLISFVLEQLAEPISKVFHKKCSTNAISAKLEDLWNVLTSAIENHYIGTYDSDFLAIISPLLEASFSHSRRQIKDRSKRFWFATFAPSSSSLKYPESLKTTLKKAKVTLSTDENISMSEEFSCTMGLSSQGESDINFNNIDLKNNILPNSSPSKPDEKNATKTDLNCTPKSQNSLKISEVKSTPKMNIDELPSSEFVKIDPAASIITTPKRRSIRKRKSFVPALYSEMSQSQDTSTFFASSESFDTSTSCEILEFKSQREVEDPTSQKETLAKANMLPNDIGENEVLNETKPCDDRTSSDEDHDEKDAEKEVVAKESQNDKQHTHSTESDLDLPPSQLDTSCMLITLSDSEEIIPSSQSSIENESVKRFPILEGSVRTLSVSSESKENYSKSTCESRTLSHDFPPVFSPAENNENFDNEHSQVPSTAVESSSAKEADPSHEGSQENAMPLKSSENLQISDKQNAEAGNHGNKPVLDNIIELMDSSEERLKATENVTPLKKKSSTIQNNVIEITTRSNLKEEFFPEDKIKSESAVVSENNELLDKELCDMKPTGVTKRKLRRKSVGAPIKAKISRATTRASLSGAIKQSSKIELLPPLVESHQEPVEKQSSVTNVISFPLEEEPDNDLMTQINSSIENILDLIDKDDSLKVPSKRKTRSSQSSNLSQEQRQAVKRPLEENQTLKKPSKKVASSNSSENAVSKLNFGGCDFVNNSIEIICIDSSDVDNKTSDCKEFVEETVSQKDVKITENVSSKNKNSNKKSKKPLKKVSKSKNSKVNEQNKAIVENLGDSEIKAVSNDEPSSIEVMEICESCDLQSFSQNDAASSTGVNTLDSSTFTSSKKTEEADSNLLDLNSCENKSSNCDHDNVNFETDAKNMEIIEEKFLEIAETPPGMLHDSQEPPVADKLDNVSIKLMEDPDIKPKMEENLKLSNESQNFSVVNVKDSDNNAFQEDNLYIKESHVEVENENLLFSLESQTGENISDINEVVNSVLNENILKISETKDDCLSTNAQMEGEKDFPNSSDLSSMPEASLEQNTEDTPAGLNISNAQDMIDILGVPSADEVTNSPDIVQDQNLLDTLETTKNEQNAQDSSTAHVIQNTSKSNIADIQNTPDSALVPDLQNLPDSTNPNDQKLFNVKDTLDLLSNSDIPDIPMEKESPDIADELNLQNTVDILDSQSNASNISATTDIMDSPDADILNSKCDKETDSDSSEDKMSEAVEHTWFGGVVISKELTCFAVPKRKRDSLKLMADKQFSSQEEKGSSRKRKGKCPKRSTLTPHTKVLVSKDEDISDASLDASGKSTLSKLGKRSMQKDPCSPKDKKVGGLTIKAFEESENKKPKRTLISSQILGKTGLVDSPQKNARDMKYDEITDMNTRFNASSGTETRRFKMMAASQYSMEKQSALHDPYQNGCEEEASRSSTSILKKRKLSEDHSSIKIRKVTFADPLVEEKLFRKDDNICTKAPIQNLMNGKESISENKDVDISEHKLQNLSVVVIPLSADVLSSSNEYQNSDNLTSYNTNPVSPTLIHCPDSIGCILKDLTSPAWTRALETLLLSKDIKTIGDLCKLNIHELKDLPFKSPKLQTLHSALFLHLTRTQKAVEKRFTSSTEHDEADLSSPAQQTDEAFEDETVTNPLYEAECMDEMAKELLKKDNLKYLQKDILVALSKKCLDEMADRLENV